MAYDDLKLKKYCYFSLFLSISSALVINHETCFCVFDDAIVIDDWGLDLNRLIVFYCCHFFRMCRIIRSMFACVCHGVCVCVCMSVFSLIVFNLIEWLCLFMAGCILHDINKIMKCTYITAIYTMPKRKNQVMLQRFRRIKTTNIHVHRTYRT